MQLMHMEEQMEPVVIRLCRSYLTEAVHGELWIQEEPSGIKTIERAWQDNTPNLSCIPEGRYAVTLAENQRGEIRLEVGPVPGREGILIHPANDAKRELRGCIAPVTYFTGQGKGVGSRRSFNRLVQLVSGWNTAGRQVVLEVERGRRVT